MKLCPNCGTQNADMYTTCTNCNAPLPAAAPQPIYGGGTNGYIPRSLQSAPVTSMGGWFGWSLLCGILPIIGAIIMICSAKDPSAKSYAKATLILQIIGLVLAAAAIALFIGVIRSVAY